MVKLHPEILKKNGKNEFVVLPYDEFLRLKDALEDAEDLRDLRSAKRREGSARAVPIEQLLSQRRRGMGRRSCR
jgi:PHD/YefM family antitoxin component YafN of YafNO toxin-antitoxin module